MGLMISIDDTDYVYYSHLCYHEFSLVYYDSYLNYSQFMSNIWINHMSTLFKKNVSHHFACALVLVKP